MATDPAAALTVTGVFTPLVPPQHSGHLQQFRYRRHRIRVSGTFDVRSIFPFFALGAPLLLIMAGKVPSKSTALRIGSRTVYTSSNMTGSFTPTGHHRNPPVRIPYNDFPVSDRGKSPTFVENAVILANVTWLILFAAVIAWLLRRSAAIPAGNDWKLAAFALLCATLLNPVFVRRIWLTSYPDMATSIVLFAGLAGWLWIEAMVRRDEFEFAKAAGFGLLLALLINIKQANLVLVVSLAVACGMVVDARARSFTPALC